MRSTGGDIKMRDLLSKYQFIKSKRQLYNLKRLPTEAKFTSNESRSVTELQPQYSSEGRELNKIQTWKQLQNP